MAKRRLLEWMRDRLRNHADKVVVPVRQKKVLDAAYAKAEPLVIAAVAKRYPAADMKVLKTYDYASHDEKVNVQFPNGVVTQFRFGDERGPMTPSRGSYNTVYLVDASTAAAVDKWLVAAGEFEEERKRRLIAYSALIAGAGYVEDIIEAWPEAQDMLPAGSPLIPLGPEQIALVKADQKERAAA